MNGWRVTGSAALALVAMCGAALAIAGADEGGVHMTVRATARTSLALFALAFTASALRRLAPAPATAWLLRNRRYVGVSFAVSHLLHLLGIAWLAAYAPSFTTDPLTLAAGGLVSLMVALMAATSSDRAAAWLGRRRWRALHLLGSWSIWLVFLVTYGPAPLESAAYLPAVGVLLAIPALRWAASRRSPQRALAG